MDRVLTNASIRSYFVLFQSINRQECMSIRLERSYSWLKGLRTSRLVLSSRGIRVTTPARRRAIARLNRKDSILALQILPWTIIL